MKRPRGLVASSLDTFDTPTCGDKHHSHDFAYLLRGLPGMLDFLGEKHSDLMKLLKHLLLFGDLQICLEQRRMLEYTATLLHKELGDLNSATTHLDLALEISGRMDDDAAQASLLYLKGEIDRERMSYRLAYDAYQQAFLFITCLQQKGVAIGSQAEFDITLRLAEAALELGKFEQCSGYLANARALRSQLSMNAYNDFLLGWHTVQLLRLTGNPVSAYKQAEHALATLDILMDERGMRNVGRFQTMTAECLLDIAANHCLSFSRAISPTYSARNEKLEQIEMYDPNLCLDLALGFLESAEHYAHEASDIGGMKMAHLAQRNRVRLGGYVVNRQFSGERSVEVATIAIGVARKIGDIPLEGRAYTSLGDELFAQGDSDGANDHYAKAFDLLRTHQFNGLAHSTWQKIQMAAKF